MDQHTLRNQLQHCLELREKVHLTRCFPHEPYHNGFVLGIGQELVLLQQFHDFYPEGFTALRLADITDVRSGEYERHWEQMLAGEGILDWVGIGYAVAFESMAALLQSLHQRGDNVIVEHEERDEATSDFYIGRILAVYNDSISFAHFDAMGQWEEHPYTISFNAITKVQFDTPYINIFSKYLATSCPLR